MRENMSYNEYEIILLAVSTYNNLEIKNGSTIIVIVKHGDLLDLTVFISFNETQVNDQFFEMETTLYIYLTSSIDNMSPAKG